MTLWHAFDKPDGYCLMSRFQLKFYSSENYPAGDLADIGDPAIEKYACFTDNGLVLMVDASNNPLYWMEVRNSIQTHDNGPELKQAEYVYEKYFDMLEPFDKLTHRFPVRFEWLSPVTFAAVIGQNKFHQLTLYYTDDLILPN